MARMQRFRWWVIECTASIVVLASFLSYRYYSPEDSKWTRADSWLSIVPSVSAFLSLLGILASVCQRDEDRVCKIESNLVWTVTALWTIAAISVTVGPLHDRNIISYDSFITIHPNLYFFSFWALIVSIILMASWFNQYIYGEDVENSTSTQWILLGALSFLSMLSGISFRDSVLVDEVVKDLGNGATDNTTTVVPVCESDMYSCDRVTFTIVLSAVSAIVACFMTPWRGNSRKCQADVSITLFIGWLCGVAFITFGSGPGVGWGSLYFSSFINLFLCLDIVIQSTAGSKGKVVHRTSSLVTRGAIFDAAYTHLERMNAESHGNFDRSASYRDLFESVRLVSGSEHGGEDNGAEQTAAHVQRHSRVDQKYQANQVNRLELWCILIIESCVNVAALIPNLSIRGERNAAHQLVLMLPSLSIVVSCFGFATCMRRSKRAKIVQGTSVALSLVIWTTAIPFLSSIADEAILGYRDGENMEATKDGNLFFSTWISVIVVLLLCTNVFQASIITSDWVLLSTFSFALMASSLVYINSQESNGNVDDADQSLTAPTCSDYKHIRDSTCKEVALAFYLGVVSGILSLMMVPLGRCGPLLHFLVSFPLVILWGIAVAYVTFSATGGVAAGILYFSCWAATLLTIDLATVTFVLLVRKYEKRKAALDGASQDEVIEFAVTNAEEVSTPPSDTEQALDARSTRESPQPAMDSDESDADTVLR